MSRAAYRISRSAASAIAEIADYTDRVFGTRQTDAYCAGLESSFELIYNFLEIGAAVFELEAGLRRYRYQSHYIFYTRQKEYVLIEQIIHARRNIRKDLFDT